MPQPGAQRCPDRLSASVSLLGEMLASPQGTQALPAINPGITASMADARPCAARRPWASVQAG
ncbi:hypothetical protein PSEUDO8AS_90054 [Pseudomonas sp. 8AS]|nr:hypothetical protein PSEUDO8AS_90054 [Pseudomonas sp. 8AS]